MYLVNELLFGIPIVCLLYQLYSNKSLFLNLNIVYVRKAYLDDYALNVHTMDWIWKTNSTA